MWPFAARKKEEPDVLISFGCSHHPAAIKFDAVGRPYVYRDDTVSVLLPGGACLGNADHRDWLPLSPLAAGIFSGGQP